MRWSMNLCFVVVWAKIILKSLPEWIWNIKVWISISSRRIVLELNLSLDNFCSSANSNLKTQGLIVCASKYLIMPKSSKALNLICILHFFWTSGEYLVIILWPFLLNQFLSQKNIIILRNILFSHHRIYNTKVKK